MKYNKIGHIVALSMLALATTSQALEYKHKTPVTGLLPPGNPYIHLSPSGLTFPATPVGGSSSLSVSVSNPDSFSSLVGLRAVLDTNAFTLDTNSCGTVATPVELHPLANCTAVLKFTPSAVGNYTGTLALAADNSTNGVQSVLLSAQATGSESISQTSNTPLSATVIQGDSHAYPFTFVNNGNIASNSTYVTLSGDSELYVQSNTCGTSGSPVSLAPAGSCSVTVLGSSIDVGSFNSVLNLYSAGNSASAQLSRALTLISEAPVVDFNYSNGIVSSGASFNFGDIPTGSSVNTSVTIANLGNVPATNFYVSIPSIEGLSSISNTCGSSASPISLAPNTNCTLSLGYGGSSSSSLSGQSVSVSSSQLVSNILMSGTAGGFNASAAWSSTTQSLIALNGSDLAFPSTMVTGSSATRSFVLYNQGTVGAMNLGLEFSGDSSDFTVTAVQRGGFSNTHGYPIYSECGATSPFVPNASCSGTDIVNGADGAYLSSRPHVVVSVAFNPTSTGTKSLTISPSSTNGTAVPSAISISGTGVDMSIASLVSGSPASFGASVQGTTPPVASVLLVNHGNVPLTISGVTGLPSSVALTGNTCSNIVANGTCSLSFTMSTASITSFSGTSVTTVGGTTNATLTMSGSVISSNTYATTSNGVISFGSVSYSASNANFADRTVNFTNSGNSAMTISSVTNLPTGVTIISNSCSSVAVNGTCSIVFRLNSNQGTSFNNQSVTLVGPTAQDPVTMSGSVDPFLSLTTVDMKFNNSLANSGTAAGSWSGTVSYGTNSPIDGSYISVSSANSITRAYDSNVASFPSDFTIEAWIRPSNATTGGFQGIYMSGAISGGQPNLGLYVSGTGKLTWTTGVYGVNTASFAGNSTIASAAWTHVAVSRSGSTIRLFVNGQLQTTTGSSTATINGSGSVFIGREYGTGNIFTGDIDLLRVTKGARYTTSFTPSVY